MADKVLTIAIPAYNAQAYLKKCLDSMVAADCLDKLEILVVDDGSTDRTKNIAESYAARFPGSVRVLSKENGGHGSAINAAAEVCAGKYLKVVDADDWIVTENLPEILSQLERCEADAVVNNYRRINIANGNVLEYTTECRYANGSPCTMEQMMEVYPQINPCCSFHGVMYRTAFYRSVGFRLSEKIFYEDNEFATIPFSRAGSILLMPLFFYVYRVGDPGQSVSYPNQVKRKRQICAVIDRMLDYRANSPPLSKAADAYYIHRLCLVIVSYYAVELVKNPDKKTGRADAKQFRRHLVEADPRIARQCDIKFRLLMGMSRLNVHPDFFHGLLDHDVYKAIRRIWTG